MTVLDLIKAAMLDISAIGQGQTPNNSEVARGFDILNTMIKGWNAARENIYSLAELSLGLTAGVQAYTIGPGGIFPTRPVAIQNASFRIAGTAVAMQMNLITAREWNGIADRSATGNVLRDLYYDYAFPLGTLNVNPVPAANVTLLLASWIPFVAFGALSDTINLPDEYFQALEYGLAVRMAPGLGLQVPPEVNAMAIEFKGNMQRFNAERVFGQIQQDTIPTVGVPQQAPPAPPQ